MTQTPEKPSITDVTNSQKDWEDFWNSENIDADFWMPELGNDPMAHRFKEILPHHPTRDEVDEMIEAKIRRHNRNASMVSMVLGIMFLAAFVDGFLRVIGKIAPFLGIDVSIMG